MPGFRTDLQNLERTAERRPGTGNGRRRFLKSLSVPFFAAAMTAFIPAETANAAPPGCYGLPTCSCCSGRTCCFPKCYVRKSCNGGVQCWATSGGQCCDWTECDYYGNNCYGCICKG